MPGDAFSSRLTRTPAPCPARSDKPACPDLRATCSLPAASDQGRQRRSLSPLLPALLWATLGCGALAAVAPAWAGEVQFQQLLRGRDVKVLSQWGRRYEHGEGVAKDIDRAIQLYCKAARGGDVSAHYHLGWIYVVGRAGIRDDELAAAWFYEAARRHDPHAQRMLARLGFEGKPRREAACPLSGNDRADAPARVAVTRKHPAHGPIAQLVRELAPQYRLDPNLVLAVIEVESNFNPQALSVKNAQGLMQLIPATAERFGVTNVWEPEQNIRGGMAYLRWLMNHFNGDLELVLAAYNAGEGAVQRHGGIPPYTETQNYVRRVIGRLN
ncbi:MAG: lytic transglycosylase [Chromatiaceae bacterium]|nr:MAG: lytic transglycosylase [Chromatiaceae bacterium]